MVVVLQWILGPLAVLAALATVIWLGQLFVDKMRRDLRNAPGGGSAYNPLQEIVQPQARHVIEVHEHRVSKDEQGGPSGP